MRLALIPCCLVFSCAAAAIAGPARVILVSFDGLRGQAVNAQTAPRLTDLARRGAATFTARCLRPTYTIPNHVSMLTGATPAAHGIVAIVDAGDIRVDGTVAEILHSTGLRTGVYLAKDKLDILIKPGAVDRQLVSTTGSSEDAVAALTADLASDAERPAFAFLHLAEPDVAGHRDGWGSDAYRQAIGTADGYLGRVLDELERRRLLESSLVIVTADHGGVGFNHDLAVPEVLEIPWIVAGPGVRGGTTIPDGVEVHDTAPTILAALGIEIPGRMEGKVIAAALGLEPALQIRGDIDASGSVDIADVMALLGHGFEGRALACPARGDADGDLHVDLTDAIVLLEHLLRDGPPLPGPYPGCGPWPQAIAADCVTPACR